MFYVNKGEVQKILKTNHKTKDIVSFTHQEPTGIFMVGTARPMGLIMKKCTFEAIKIKLMTCFDELFFDGKKLRRGCHT